MLRTLHFGKLWVDSSAALETGLWPASFVGADGMSDRQAALLPLVLMAIGGVQIGFPFLVVQAVRKTDQVKGSSPSLPCFRGPTLKQVLQHQHLSVYFFGIQTERLTLESQEW